MRKILSIIALGIFFAALGGCDENDPSQPDGDETLEKKIGQMLLIGFRGMEIDENNPIYEDLRQGRVGGVVLYDYDVVKGAYDRNIESPEQVKALNQSISQLYKYADAPPFISVDQEGGRICRLKEKYGFPKTYSQQYLGELNNSDSTRANARVIASTLNDNYFNLNFAPVVDLNVNPDCPAIGKLERSFSSDPDVVFAHSSIVIEEHNDFSIATALKHFPGHGSSKADSHEGFTDVTDTWSEAELEPYSRLIDAGKVKMVMTAHIFNANLDANYPATLSKNIITGILREQMGYDGVIVTDDMNMGAIAENYGLETAIELSIVAGADILLFANNLTYDPDIAVKARDIILNLISEGKISKDRIDESYDRIMKLKNEMKAIM